MVSQERLKRGLLRGLAPCDLKGNSLIDVLTFYITMARSASQEEKEKQLLLDFSI